MTEKKINLDTVLTSSQYVLIGSFFGFILGVMLFTFFTPNYYQEEEPIEVFIPKGAVFEEVIDSLFKSDVISSKLYMRVAGFLYSAEHKVKYGRYQIPNGLSYLDLTELLIRGVPDEQILVTIPEGIWLEDLAWLLSSKLGINPTEFIRLCYDNSFIRKLNIDAANLEGYLLPESYYFYANSSPESVIIKLIEESRKILNLPENQKKLEELNFDVHSLLTLSSIVEAETQIFSEYPLIAGVYINRLNKGMKLQADPTVQYLKKNKGHNRILFSDLGIDSPYNTYLYSGLPPGPINNPGKAAIMGVLNYQKTDYLFFVADGSGGHKFSKNYYQHQKNVQDYREWRKTQ